MCEDLEKGWAWEAKDRLDKFMVKISREKKEKTDDVRQKIEIHVKKIKQWMEKNKMPVCIYIYLFIVKL